MSLLLPAEDVFAARPAVAELLADPDVPAGLVFDDVRGGVGVLAEDPSHDAR